MAMRTVKTECEACDGTGLYCGFAEADGEAVICLHCDGTGCYKLRYKPFERRKGRRGIKSIFRSRGGFLATGVGKVGGSITYAEFKKGKMPK